MTTLPPDLKRLISGPLHFISIPRYSGTYIGTLSQSKWVNSGRTRIPISAEKFGYISYCSLWTLSKWQTLNLLQLMNSPCLSALGDWLAKLISLLVCSNAGDWLIYWHICVRRLYSHIWWQILKTNSSLRVRRRCCLICTSTSTGPSFSMQHVGNGLIFSSGLAKGRLYCQWMNEWGLPWEDPSDIVFSSSPNKYVDTCIIYSNILRPDFHFLNDTYFSTVSSPFRSEFAADEETK